MSRRKQKNPICFLPSALSTKDFFSYITTKLSYGFYEEGYPFAVEVCFKEKDYDLNTQKHVFEWIVDNYRKFTGIILIPVDLIKLKNLIIILLKKDKKYPIITYDLGYKLDSDFEEYSLTPPAYVKVNDYLGGKQAASGLIHYCMENSVKLKKIGILRGTHAYDRVEGFKESLKGIGIKFEESKKIEWNRMGGRTECERMLIESKKLGHSEKFDAFFCCNDEMALGAKDAIQKFENDHPELFQAYSIKVIGFDGIDEVKALIDTKDPHIIYTVDVMIDAQITGLVANLLELIKHGGNYDGIKRENEIKPELFPKIKKK